MRIEEATPRSASTVYQMPGERVHERAAVITPERVALTFSYAGIGSRFVALAIDGLIQFAAMLVVIVAAIRVGIAGGGRPVGGVLGIALLVVLLFGIFSGYFVIFEALWNGQTPGKRVAKIRVVRTDGRPAGWMGSAVRNIVRIADLLPGLYLVGIVSVFLSRENRRLGDFAAGTIVVRDEGLAAPEVLRPESLSDAVPVDPLRASRLRPEEYELIRAFLLRRATLDPIARRDLAGRIAAPIAARLGIAIGGMNAGELFLERLARAYREHEAPGRPPA